MNPDTLICNTSNITYSKGYIAVWLEDIDLPAAVDVEGEELLVKDHLHVSLLCVKNILADRPQVEQDLLQHFCEFLQSHDIAFEAFTGEFRVAEREERKSLVAMWQCVR